MASLQDLIDVIQDLINQGVDVRFIKDAVAHDINISPDTTGLYRFHTKESSELDHLEANLASGVIIDDTASMYSNLVFSYDGWIHGFNAWGETDGIFILLLNSVEIGREQSNATKNAVNFKLPIPIPISAGDSLELTVTNCGIQTASYKGSIYSEVRS